MTTTRWWWVRHAPVRDHGGRLYGRSEVAADLSDTAALKALAARLPEKAIWLASPLSRTKETARVLAALRAGGTFESAAIAIEPDIIEQDFGSWQGKTYAEIAELQGGEMHAFWFAAAHATPEGGESFIHTMARVAEAVARLTQAHEGSEIVAVAHAGVIRAAVAVALDLDAEAALRLAVDTLSLTQLDHIRSDNRAYWRVTGVNFHG